MTPTMLCKALWKSTALPRRMTTFPGQGGRPGEGLVALEAQWAWIVACLAAQGAMRGRPLGVLEPARGDRGGNSLTLCTINAGSAYSPGSPPARGGHGHR